VGLSLLAIEDLQPKESGSGSKAVRMMMENYGEVLPLHWGCLCCALSVCYWYCPVRLLLSPSHPDSTWGPGEASSCLAAELGLSYSDPEGKFGSEELTLLKCSGSEKVT